MARPAPGQGDRAAPAPASAFSTYASRFLSGAPSGLGGPSRPSSSRGRQREKETPVFRSDIPDPYSPTRSSSRSPSLPRLAGSSATLPTASALLFHANVEGEEEDEAGNKSLGAISVAGLGKSRRVEVPALDELEDIDGDGEEDEDEEDIDPFRSAVLKKTKGRGKQQDRSRTPPSGYSLNLSPSPPQPKPPQKKGWLAHHSIFPSRSRYDHAPLSDSEEESERGGPEEDSEEDAESKPSDPPSPRVGMGKAGGDRRYHPKSSSLSDSEDDPGEYAQEDLDDRQYDLDGDEDEDEDSDDRSRTKRAKYQGEALEDPLIPRELGIGVIPQRLEVYQGALGHWKGDHALPLRKYRDAGWLALWLTSVVGVWVGLCFVWGSTDPTPIPPKAPGGITYRTPFSTLLHTIPLLAVLVGIAVFLPLGFLLALKWAVRPVLMGTAVLIPFSLLLSSWWAFIASFEVTSMPSNTNTDGETNWWGTTGLRLLALIPLALAGLSGRMVWRRWKRLNGTVKVVQLSTKLLIEHPTLLLLNPALLAAFTILSLPYLTLVLRLMLVGYYRHPRENTWIWHVKPYAGLLTTLVILLWLWSWVVLRGIGRVVTAAVVGEWYFHREQPDRPEMTAVTVAALHRATGPSLGSICLSSLIVAVMRFAGRGAAQARRIVHPRANILPTPLSFLSNLTPLFQIIAGVLDQLNSYALIYVGITGEAFWPSARKAVALAGSRGGAGGRLLDYTFVKLLLTLTSTALAMACATIGYLYAVHALSAPAHAPLTALLCGGVPFLAVRASAGILSDASDAVFICSAIDREAGTQHCPEALEAFSPEGKVATGVDIV